MTLVVVGVGGDMTFRYTNTICMRIHTYLVDLVGHRLQSTTDEVEHQDVAERGECEVL